jgi:hypothetical protein
MACIAVLFASISGSGAGCAHKYVEKVAVFARDGDRDVAVVQAPRSGMYHVQFIANDKYVKTPLYASDRWVMKGDPLGFREDDDGHLIAIAGEDEVALPDAPAQATHVMWYHKSKRPTQFAKSLALTLEVSAKLAAVGAMSADRPRAWVIRPARNW